MADLSVIIKRSGARDPGLEAGGFGYCGERILELPHAVGRTSMHVRAQGTLAPASPPSAVVGLPRVVDPLAAGRMEFQAIGVD